MTELTQEEVFSDREIKDVSELQHFVQQIANVEITSISQDNAAAKNGKELIRVRAMAQKIEKYLDGYFQPVDLEISYRKDAERFRALMRCPRIKMQGSAGVDPKTGDIKYPDKPGSVHFGAEFWTTPSRDRLTGEVKIFSDCTREQTQWGHHALAALADDILAVEKATGYQHDNNEKYEDRQYEKIEIEKDAVARLVGRYISPDYNWQHIREASAAFTETLERLHMNKE